MKLNRTNKNYKERIMLEEIKSENDAREFVVGKLVDLCDATHILPKKDFRKRVIVIEYFETLQQIRESHGIDTAPYESFANKLIEAYIE